MNSPLDELREVLDRLDLLPIAEREEAATVMRGWADAQARAEPLPKDGLPGRFGMIGSAAAMEKVYDLVARIVRTDVPVLVLGESGTGKELVAQALHSGGPRRKGPLVAVNCAAIPATLLEAELFGHVKGSFTGAHRDRKGYAESADGGTLFLDEIGEIPLDLQAKLLRFLQDGEVRAVGANVARRVDVRIVAATNRDLAARVAAKEFREDLYYRIAVLTLQLPPLRDRREDIPHLAQFLLARQEGQGMPSGKLTDEARAALCAFDWPGNIRQLENELVRASAFASGGVITPAELSDEVRAAVS